MMETPQPLQATSVDHSHHKKGGFFLYSDRNSGFLFPFPLAQSLATTADLICIPSHQVFICTDKTHSSLLFPRLKSPGSLRLSSSDRWFSPFIILVALHWACFTVSPYLSGAGEPSPGHSSPDESHQCWAEGKDHLPRPAGSNTPNAAQDAVKFSLPWRHIAGSVCRDTHTLLRRAAFQLVSPQHVLGVIPPQRQSSALPPLNFTRSLAAQFSSLSRSLWMAAHPPGVSATPLSFALSSNLLRVHSVPASRSFKKMLNSTRPRVDPGEHH